jgi:hypothetical protein
MKCSTCAYWNEMPRLTPTEDVLGTCRRNPPKAFEQRPYWFHIAASGAISPISYWPATRPDDWCGEWKARGESGANADTNVSLDWTWDYD